MTRSSSLVLVFALGFCFSLTGCNCGNDVTIGGCTTTTCADGCCDAQGKCQVQAASTCGINASVCKACSSGESCSVGVCVTGGAGGGNGGTGGGHTGTGGGTSGTGGGGEGNGGGVPYDGGCGPIMVGNPPYPRKCAPPTDNECQGSTDTALTGFGVEQALLNGSAGNGFDDDCDGQVDEGCSCPANGLTKDCYLVPATQADNTGKPVGWCTTNAKGSLDCAGGEIAVWSGVCRGGQQPNPHDTCGPGDFNCDGLAGNSDTTGCSCATAVQCPSTTVTQAPYPPETAIPLLDGTLWITDASQRANATNWKWTVVGGDCDNVLPYPTFALYNSANSTGSNARKGTRTPVHFDTASSRYVAMTGEPIIAIQASNYGTGVAGGKVYPAFALSGDYLVQGEFDLGSTHYSCTQKIAIRAPGIRAELCWDTVGGDNGTDGNDIDLHFARLQGAVCSSSTQGWDSVCENKQDCYYLDSSGCPSYSSQGPAWGYTTSTNAACLGWGSKRISGGLGCTNPRLDLDNVSCDRGDDDPTDDEFCGPENINLDNPNDNDAFVVSANFYGNSSGPEKAKPHVNLYCNGERVLSVGYNPATGQTSYPLLANAGMDSSGDMFIAATIKAHVTGGQLMSCDVASIPSHHADTTRDGMVTTSGAGDDVCVDSKHNSSPGHVFNYSSHEFVDNGSAQGIAAGSLPMTPAQWCKH